MNENPKLESFTLLVEAVRYTGSIMRNRNRLKAESEHAARRRVLCSYLSKGFQVLSIRVAEKSAG